MDEEPTICSKPFMFFFGKPAASEPSQQPIMTGERASVVGLAEKYGLESTRNAIHSSPFFEEQTLW